MDSTPLDGVWKTHKRAAEEKEQTNSRARVLQSRHMSSIRFSSLARLASLIVALGSVHVCGFSNSANDNVRVVTVYICSHIH